MFLHSTEPSRSFEELVCLPWRCLAELENLPAGLPSRQAGWIQVTSASHFNAWTQVPDGWRARRLPPPGALPSTAGACTVVIRRYKILIYIAGRVIYTLM